MTENKPSKQSAEALRVATAAMKLGNKQATQIEDTQKMSSEALNKINTHEEICALRAKQTLDKVEVLDNKIDKLISGLFGAVKVVATAFLTGAAAIIVWLIQSNGGS